MFARAIPVCVLVPLLSVAIVVTMSACATVNSVVDPPAVDPKRPDAPPIYGGVRVHIKDVTTASDEKALMAAAIDLPLCAAADTLLLPLTVFFYVREEWLKQSAKKMDRPISPPSETQSR